MEQTLNSLTKLLERLGPDKEQAGENYENLRRTLNRFFEGRGAPFPEEQTDETFDRVARKLDEGIEIANIGGYCYEVARLVCLEAFKRPSNFRMSLDDVEVEPVARDNADEITERENLLACLDDCLRELPSESRELIKGYYSDEKYGQTSRRKALAERLGLRRDALANRAQRLRDKLEQCVTRCLKKKSAI